MENVSWEITKSLLFEGKVGIIPTDTIYGFSASIAFSESIEKIYTLKGRDSDKPLVLLAASLEQIKEILPVIITNKHRELVDRATVPTTIIYDIDPEKTGGWNVFPSSDSLAIRIPAKKPELITLLEIVGPIVSTSVNRQGQQPLTDPERIRTEFGNLVDFIINEGVTISEPSKIVAIIDGNIQFLR